MFAFPNALDAIRPFARARVGSVWAILLIHRLTQHLKELGRQADEIGAQIGTWHRNNGLSCKLTAIAGVGPISASALAVTVGLQRIVAGVRERERIVVLAGSTEPSIPLARGRGSIRKDDGVSTGLLEFGF